MQIQVLDINYRSQQDNTPALQLFGNDISGNSHRIEITGFQPYFYVQPLKKYIKEVLQSLKAMQLKTGLVKRFKPLGYQSQPIEMIKVWTVSPRDVRELRDKIKLLPYVEKLYEADILFNQRFMADCNVEGMSWIDVPGENIDYKEVKVIKNDSDAPLRFMGIDIEVLPPEDGSFPLAAKDPAILISVSFNPAYNGLKDLVLVAKDTKCSRPDVWSFSGEYTMLQKLLQLFNEYDPDVVLGYNVEQFDFPYLDTRLMYNNIKANFGRNNSHWYIREFGKDKSVSIPGRVVVDLLPIIRKNYSFKQYGLKYVAPELLKLEKLDVPAKVMRQKWFATGREFAEFISYSRRDAVLAMLLLGNTGMFPKYVALAKASGILLQGVISGGQSGMLEFMHLKRFNAKNRVVNLKPDIDPNENDRTVNYQGAYVSEPEVGLHDNLDLFDMQSLYPSQIIAHNICPTTVIIDEECKDISVDPNGSKFVNPSTCKGILPEMLDEVLKKRKDAKKLMKEAKTDKEKDLYDSIQYAYKIMANSAYGFAGYARSRVFNISVASAVTAYGRDVIKDVRDQIETMPEMEINKKKFTFHVVYTDTDSAYVKMKCNKDITLKDANDVGNKVAGIISAPMPYPMKLNFEGYAKRSLFLAKKRYAMLMVDEKGEKIKVKGIETVRRDWCELTANTMNKCLEVILKQGDIEAAKKLSMDAINRVRDLSPSDSQLFDQLVLTRKYGKTSGEYKNKQPHMVLLEKMRLRGEELPGIGDRIPFIIIKGKTKRDRAREKFVERAETPARVKELKIPIDVEYYVNHQLLPPLARMLQPFGITSKELDMHNQCTLLAFL
jgi:DNA polymerase I